MGRKALAVFEKVLDVMAILAAILLVLNMLFVSVDALGRYLFNHPLVWITEISEYSLLYITFLGAAWLLRREGHVAVEIVLDRLTVRKRAFMGIFSSVIGAISSAVIAWYGLLLTVDYWRRGLYDASLLEIPRWPIIAIIPLGSILIAIQFIIRGNKFYVQWRRRGEFS